MQPDDDIFREMVARALADMLADKPLRSAGLAPSLSGFQGSSMAAEVAVLKQRADQADQRMGRIEDKLDRMAETLTDIRVGQAGLATRGQLWGMVATVVAISVAVLGIVVGILTWVQALHT